MVWDDGLSVREVNEEKKKTAKFPSRERNFAVRRRGPRRTVSVRESGVSLCDNMSGDVNFCRSCCNPQPPTVKNCTSCKCPKEAHDVCHEEWVSVRARLGLKGDGTNNYVGFEPRERGLAWAPPGLPPNKVEEYFSMLPEISVPRLGTQGERHRDRQLSTQLPKQDLARAYCRHLDPQHSASADDFMAARNEIALDIGTVQEVFERNQECGACHEPLKYGSLVVMASKRGQLYHPVCFKCTHCDELLVDLAYCVHDDTLYCERHYAEELKPRCAACDELIFSGEYTKAMNKDWHSGHFCCWQCDESLTGQRYVLRDEHPYCIKCYESIFANGCEECNKIIGIDSKDLSYKDKHWHEACFLCHKCRVSLVDKQFGSKVDKIYCGNCYDAQFASRCDGCGEIFRAGTKKMEYKTRQWHEKCFCCVVCKNPIGLKSFIPREQEIYCAGCYEDKFATRCVKCNKIITSGGVTYKNEPWHRDCFTCTHCNNSLAGQRFTSRDDKPYCAECFGELFAKRCTSCAKPITGIGGTRFISFEDRHWHNDCFICAGCKTSLVGRGFITDAEDIICPECAKAKLTTE
ncbi:prickle-like protein 3 isoform X4 [Fopius arisanus]|uniref:Prickle-like protein 3 isoform X4 n=2 Tax=Fopius arisanus TaxID=64838 RepID=A0A9R1TPF5_9HYME|nr:PREDICTED: prickle-like protein 3 isoform X4 [Fopius arisanus]